MQELCGGELVIHKWEDLEAFRNCHLSPPTNVVECASAQQCCVGASWRCEHVVTFQVGGVCILWSHEPKVAFGCCILVALPCCVSANHIEDRIVRVWRPAQSNAGRGSSRLEGTSMLLLLNFKSFCVILLMSQTGKKSRNGGTVAPRKGTEVQPIRMKKHPESLGSGDVTRNL
eukprot:2106938-Amphidinium_carterae.1